MTERENIQEVISKEDILKVAGLAEEIWHEYFPCILSEEQIDYMVMKFQSYEAMVRQIEEEGYTYYKLLDRGSLIGYFAVREEEKDSALFLSKLYIHKSSRGFGHGSKAFEFLRNYCLNKGYKKIWLTVNRFNDNTILTYKRKGFTETGTRVLDIGNGYVMDDLIMEWMI